jgi:hypothetical protein
MQSSYLQHPSSLFHSPENPKITLQQLEQLETTCKLAISSMPLSKIPSSLMHVFEKRRREQFSLVSLKSKPHVHKSLIDLLGSEEDRSQFPLRVWQMRTTMLSSNDHDDAALHDCIALALTNF